MPDLFVGGAAPALGHVAWVENAFAPAVKADASYLRTAIDALSKLFFQDCVLPELRPSAADPPGEAGRRLAVIFENCFTSYALPGGSSFSGAMPPPGGSDEDKSLFFAAQEVAFFTQVPTALASLIRQEMARHFPHLLHKTSGLASLTTVPTPCPSN